MALLWPDGELLPVAPQLLLLLALLPIVVAAVRQRLMPDEGRQQPTKGRKQPLKASSVPATATEARLHGRSATACWDRGDGSLKYKILRPDDGSREEDPPRLLVKDDPALPLRPMTEKEEVGVQVMEASVADLREDGRRIDREDLLRFFEARKGNVCAAVGYYRELQAYSDELNLQQIDTDWNLEAYERCFAPWWVRGGIVGTDLHGNVVGWERFGRSGLPQILKEVPWEVLKRLDALHMMRVKAAFEEYSLQSGRPIGNTILVLDFDGFTWDYCKPSVVRAYSKLVNWRDMMLPATLAHIFLIRVPKPFSVAWSMFKPLLDPRTAEKVQIVSGDRESLALMRKYMPDSTIPAYIGGSLKTGCDPDCRAILGSAEADVPSEAIARLLAEAASKRSGAGARQPARDAKVSSRACCLSCLGR